MEKYIIRNRSRIPSHFAIFLVGQFMSRKCAIGRIKTFGRQNVTCKKNKGESFTFTITDN